MEHFYLILHPFQRERGRLEMRDEKGGFVVDGSTIVSHSLSFSIVVKIKLQKARVCRLHVDSKKLYRVRYNRSCGWLS